MVLSCLVAKSTYVTSMIEKVTPYKIYVGNRTVNLAVNYIKTNDGDGGNDV